jgi:hypothetical protein
MRYTGWLLLITLACVTLLSGCGATRVGWQGSHGPRYAAYHYSSFDGLYRDHFHARAGQLIRLNYDVVVQHSQLSLCLAAPDGAVLWEETFERDTADSLNLIAPSSGRYDLRLQGAGTAGGFDLIWCVGT